MNADGTDGEPTVDYAEGRRYCTAVAEALTDAGIPPTERWDESGGTALYWTEGDPALEHGPWRHGIVVFWGTRGGHHGWGCAPLDAKGDPLLTTATWLPVHPKVAPSVLANQLSHLFADGVGALAPGASTVLAPELTPDE
ncbi:hypothetical protein ACFV8E_07015 [Streptomyces sp. NPDC059849]|uniref:hypothetical protein n=1 Tax=unclassified Streptomyces TaxID=2593676 RepID=UPI00365D49D3